jgi:hypothetical protein
MCPEVVDAAKCRCELAQRTSWICVELGEPMLVAS